MTPRRTLLKSATAALALTVFGPLAANADEPLPVVATFSILGDMVARVGGEHVAVTTLVDAGGDAHVYQPTPADARDVSSAEVLFVNGLEFEGWIERLEEASGFDGLRVVATTGIDAIPFEEGDHDDHHEDDDHADHDDEHEEHSDHDDHDHDDEEHADHDDHDHDDKEHADHDDHDHDDEEHADHDDEHEEHDHEEHAEHDDHDDHHGHDHGAFDPHAWQSLTNGVIYATNIAEALSSADPDNAATYQANAEVFIGEMEALEAEIEGMMASLPADARTVVTSHDAFGYFADRYGLTFEAPQGLSTESEPSAADVAAMITQIREEGISAVFVESITDNRLLEQIALETGATIGGTLYSDALSEEGGPASTYLDMMRHNATTLSEALGS